jgi:thymidine kinase
MDDGSIEVICGPMFSKKTTKLIALTRNAQQKYGAPNVLAVKNSIDNRYDLEKIVSHDGTSEKAIAVPSLDVVRGIVNYFTNIKIIIIDEAQFFHNLREFSSEMREAGKHVIVAGLDKDWQQNDFKSMFELRRIANIETLLYSRCTDCKGKASYTFRVINSKDDILVGGADFYTPVCAKCYEKRSNAMKK